MYDGQGNGVFESENKGACIMSESEFDAGGYVVD